MNGAELDNLAVAVANFGVTLTVALMCFSLTVIIPLYRISSSLDRIAKALEERNKQ